MGFKRGGWYPPWNYVYVWLSPLMYGCQFIFLGVCVSVWMTALHVSPFVCLDLYLDVSLDVWMSIHLYLCVSECLSGCLDIYLSVWISVWMSVRRCVYYDVWMS